MKLIVLSDSRAKENLQAEHGLSFYIEHDNIKILFDTEASDIFLKNVIKLGIELDTIDMVVLSHGHFDHGDGLQYLKYAALSCHPECFVKRYRKNGLVVVSGCAHSGICNMIEHAKKVTGVNRIKAVIGGLHLKSVHDQTLKTIEYMIRNNIQQVFPSHCTMEPALSTFYKTFGHNEVMAGQEIIFEQ